MALTNEHWNCITRRALPILLKRTHRTKVAERIALQEAYKAAQLAARTARDAAEDEGTPENIAALKSAMAELKPAQSALEAKRAELEALAHAPGQVEEFKTHWELLGDAEALGGWCDAAELEEFEADIAEQQAAIDKAKEELAARKAKG